MKITPRQKKLLRIPTSSGNTPPIKGPARLPAIIPDDKMPSAQPERDLGVCVATKMVAPEAYPPNKPARSLSNNNCQTVWAKPIKDIATAMPRLARINISLRP